MNNSETQKQLNLIIAMKSLMDRQLGAQMLLSSDPKTFRNNDYTRHAKIFADVYLEWMKAVAAMGNDYPDSAKNRYGEVCNAVATTLRLLEMSFMSEAFFPAKFYIHDLEVILKRMLVILSYYVTCLQQYWEGLSEKEKEIIAEEDSSSETLVYADLGEPIECISKTIYDSEYFKKNPKVFIEIVNGLGALYKYVWKCISPEE